MLGVKLCAVADYLMWKGLMLLDLVVAVLCPTVVDGKYDLCYS